MISVVTETKLQKYQVVHSEQYNKILHICTNIIEVTFQLQTPTCPPLSKFLYTPLNKVQCS